VTIDIGGRVDATASIQPSGIVIGGSMGLMIVRDVANDDSNTASLTLRDDIGSRLPANFSRTE